jgi:hypothetical protein
VVAQPSIKKRLGGFNSSRSAPSSRSFDESRPAPRGGPAFPGDVKLDAADWLNTMIVQIRLSVNRASKKVRIWNRQINPLFERGKSIQK